MAWNAWDTAAVASFSACLLLETVADQQQWNFQEKKHSLIAKKEVRRRYIQRSIYILAHFPHSLARACSQALTGDYQRGFLSSGLFFYSRHPNFFAEICLWFCYYAFSISSSGTVFNWTLTGAVLLLLLFQGSTPLTESITLSKYPAYKDYQRTTSRIIPWPFHAAISNKKSA